MSSEVAQIALVALICAVCWTDAVFYLYFLVVCKLSLVKMGVVALKLHSFIRLNSAIMCVSH